MRLIALVCAGFLVMACQSTSPNPGVSNAIRFAYPSMGFRGSYCRELTVDDVRQIVNLARSRADIRKPVDEIVADRPNEVEVETGSPGSPIGLQSKFKAQKKNGWWMIIEGSIHTNRVIITG